MSLYTFVLVAMLTLAKSEKLVPADLAQAIAYAVAQDGAPKGWTPELAAAALVVSAWEEGRFCVHCKRGDHGVAVTTWQIHARSEGHARQLEGSNSYAARTALAIIRIGAEQCPGAELAPFCGGCRSSRARAMSARRMAEARRIVGTAP